ncbi:hypothetical protein JCM8547_002868 [Rhodosporidiobolus lusitaniae]
MSMRFPPAIWANTPNYAPGAATLAHLEALKQHIVAIKRDATFARFVSEYNFHPTGSEPEKYALEHLKGWMMELAECEIDLFCHYQRAIGKPNPADMEPMIATNLSSDRIWARAAGRLPSEILYVQSRLSLLNALRMECLEPGLTWDVLLARHTRRVQDIMRARMHYVTQRPSATPPPAPLGSALSFSVKAGSPERR